MSLLDTFVAADLPILAKAFFVTLFVLAAACALGAGSALIAWVLRAFPIERKH